MSSDDLLLEKYDLKINDLSRLDIRDLVNERFSDLEKLVVSAEKYKAHHNLVASNKDRFDLYFMALLNVLIFLLDVNVLKMDSFKKARDCMDSLYEKMLDIYLSSGGANVDE